VDNAPMRRPLRCLWCFHAEDTDRGVAGQSLLQPCTITPAKEAYVVKGARDSLDDKGPVGA